ncbi:DUF58 domain-containing protein [Ectothiorhodospiraceae bacterium BW-2]|nr:DUF58 domain-containing protein [Ectothiorhodospiraceae bacterium BW-2]
MPQLSVTPVQNPVAVTVAELIRLRYQASLLGKKPPLFLAPRAGLYHSNRRGRGMEFAEVRPYMPGDDVRTIDWRVTARSSRPHTKLFREELERQSLLLVDFRQTMHFATTGSFKSVLASRLAAMLAWQAQQVGDRLGGVVFSARQHLEVRPRLGRVAVLALLYQLANHPVWQQLPRPEPKATLPFWHLLVRLRRVASPGSQITLISDFMQLQPECEPHLRELSRRCEVRFIHLYDRLEQELPPSGHYSLTDQRRVVSLFTGSERLRQHHRQQFQHRCDYLQQLSDRYDIALLRGDTRSDPLTLLSQSWYRRLGGYGRL